MTAARSVPAPSQAAATSVRLGRVHTIRIPEPLWQTIQAQAAHELRRDGASEIVREIVEDHVRQLLVRKGIQSGRTVTMDDVAQYCHKVLGYLLDEVRAEVGSDPEDATD
jgi:hypothetical protein